MMELRTRGRKPVRTAQVQLRSGRTDLAGPRRPGGCPAPLPDVGVVEVLEVAAPAGVRQPLHWFLLTSLPCATLAEARQVAGCQAARWRVEEYHKGLRCGVREEAGKLGWAGGLEPLMAMLGVEAVPLLNAKILALSRPDSFESAPLFEPLLLEILEQKHGRPKGGWTNARLLVNMAQPGGFPGRKGDGLPGWGSLWGGWRHYAWMCQGAKMFLDSLKDGKGKGGLD